MLFRSPLTGRTVPIPFQGILEKEGVIDVAVEIIPKGYVWPRSQTRARLTSRPVPLCGEYMRTGLWTNGKMSSGRKEKLLAGTRKQWVASTRTCFATTVPVLDTWAM
jgi:hypothetical protein